jgi:hypothetical protein
MINDRPIDDPNLRRAMMEVQRTLARHGLAGAVMLVAEDEVAWTYVLHAPWSALRKDDSAQLGFRFRAQSVADGKELTEKRVLGAMHTICQISDFGEQTTTWMEDMKLALRRRGIEFTHTPFGGQPLQHLEFGP